MELAPAVLPAVCNLRDRRVRELGEDSLAGRSVGCKLDSSACGCLFEPLRRQLDEASAELFGGLGERGDGDPDQRNAFFSFSKKPW
jgi:hypothetical protein